MKILIVKLSAFGDIIHCLPALDDVLSHPEVTEVHWLVDERFAFVTDVFPQQVHIHQVRMKGKDRASSIIRTVGRLRRLNLDLVIDLQGLIKSALLARLLGRPVFGFDKRLVPEKAASWMQTPVVFHTDERHVVQQYRRIARQALEASASGSPAEAIAYTPPEIHLHRSRLALDGQAIASLGLEGKDFVVLHVGGGWQTKHLPENTWLDVANGLHDTGLLPVFSWGNDTEKAEAQKLASQSKGFALPQRLNMSALAAVLKQAVAVIGPDTGLIHLAAALGTPTVSFWGPSASWRSAPFGDQQGVRHCHIESNPACGPCFKRTCDHFICMDGIRAEAILEAIRSL